MINADEVKYLARALESLKIRAEQSERDLSISLAALSLEPSAHARLRGQIRGLVQTIGSGLSEVKERLYEFDLNRE